MKATLKHASYVPGTYAKQRPDYAITAEMYMKAWAKKHPEAASKRRNQLTFRRPSASHEKSGPVRWKSPTCWRQNSGTVSRIG